MDEFKLFISHKHTDAAIAKVVANFVRKWSLGRIQIHLSSDPKYRGPGIGGPLNDQLKQALWKTDALVLVYTTADKDWSYCMWECGVATDPSSPESRMYVLQCGSDVPSPFAQDVRANARSLDDVRKFTDTLLRGRFFPNQNEALAPSFESSEIFDAADELYKEMQSVLPPLGSEAIEEWSSWPRLEITLPAAEGKEIERATKDVRPATAARVLQAAGIVRNINDQAAQVFGRGSIKAGTPFNEVLKAWIEGYGDGRDDGAPWFNPLAEQIAGGLVRNMVLLSKTPIRSVTSGRSSTPFLSTVRRTAAEDRFDFEIFLLDLVDPRVVSVLDRMIPIESTFYILIEEKLLTEIRLKEIRNELTRSMRSRVPVLGRDCRPLYIMHLSMIDQFMLDYALNSNNQKAPEALSLGDILSNNHYRTMFESTFAVVPDTSTVSDALLAMRDRHPNCRDAFITKNGSTDAPVLGWLTNVDAAF